MNATTGAAGDKKEVPLKSLPKQLQLYYSIPLIRSADLSNEDKLNLLKLHGKGAKDWTPPKSARVREFALDMVLFQLNEAQTFKVNTFVNLHEKAIKWIIREAQEIIKKEPTLLELEAPIKVTGDFHG